MLFSRVMMVLLFIKIILFCRCNSCAMTRARRLAIDGEIWISRIEGWRSYLFCLSWQSKYFPSLVVFQILFLVFSSRAAIWRSFLQRRCKQIAHMATGAVVCALNSNAKPYYVFSEIVDILSDPEDDAKW